MDKLYKSRLNRFIFVIISITIISIFIGYLSAYIYPFVLAFIFSMILHPIVSLIVEKWKVNRGLATFISISIFFIINTICGYFLIKRLLLELTQLATKLPQYITNISNTLHELETTYISSINQFISKFLPSQQENEQALSQLISENLKEYSTAFVEKSVFILSESLTSIAYVLLVLFFIVLATYFMTKDYPKIMTLLKQYAPTRLKRFSIKITHFFKQSLVAIIKAQLMIALLTAVLSFIGLSIFRVEHVLVLCMILFFVDLIPYVGIGIIYLPWILFMFLQEEYVITVQLSVLYIIIIVIRQIIEPRLLAKNLGIHPLITIAILFISIEVFGAFGVFITPLILMIISSLYHAKVIQIIVKYIKEGYI